MNTEFEYRERLGHTVLAGAGAYGGTPTSVVSGPSCVLLAVRWLLPAGTCRELFAASGSPLEQVRDYRAIHDLKRALCQTPAADAALPERSLQEIFALLRLRLRAAYCGPADSDTARLKRIILDHARSAGHDRNGIRIELLDAILDRLSTGLSVGPTRELAQILAGNALNACLQNWLIRNPPRPAAAPTCRIEAILCANGIA
jgi:hypothetical protein